MWGLEQQKLKSTCSERATMNRFETGDTQIQFAPFDFRSSSRSCGSCIIASSSGSISGPVCRFRFHSQPSCKILTPASDYPPPPPTKQKNTQNEIHTSVLLLSPLNEDRPLALPPSPRDNWAQVSGSPCVGCLLGVLTGLAKCPIH